MTKGTAPLVEILMFADCPNAAPAIALVDRVGRELATELELRIVQVVDSDAALRERFLGSPTIRVDGRDVEPGADDRDDYSLSCRVYAGGQGLSGQPDQQWVRDAIERARRP